MSEQDLVLYAAVGADRYVAHSEVALSSGWAQRVWDVYDRHFARFTGAGLDPEFARLRLGDRPLEVPRFASASAVMVVGDAPLDARTIAGLRDHRQDVTLLASPAAAVRLQAAGLPVDLVLVESNERVRPVDLAALDSRTTWLVDRSVSAPLSPNQKVRVAASLPTWGLWPATAVALAIDNGARMVALAGISPSEASSHGRALTSLLDLLAHQDHCACVHLDGGDPWSPAWRRGWTALGTSLERDPRIEWVGQGSAWRFIDEGRADLARIAPVLAEARRALTLALDARANAGTSRELHRAIEMLLAWGADSSLRWSLQRGLGLAFLPRLWRHGVSMGAGAARLWRPLVLALQELVDQAGALARHLERAAGPQTRERLRSASPASPDRVSVVLPVLGGDVSRVGDAVASLAAQTHAAIEILVVHDGIAGTELADHLRHAPSGVRLLGLPGATLDAALNHAIEAARGDLIAHHDADGLSHPQRLARQVDYLRHHPDIDVVAASTMALSGSDAVPCGYLCEPDAQTPAALARRLEERHPLAHGSVIVRRAALERVGGYRPQAAGGAEAVERDLWLRLRDTSRMAKLPTRLYGRVVSLAPTGAGAPSGPRDGHAPPGAEGTLADAEAGGRLAALELR